MKEGQSYYGYSLIELIVSISILTIFFTLGTVVFTHWVRQDRLDIAAQRVISLASETQAKCWANYSVDGLQGVTHGIHFNQDKLVLFVGLPFAPEAIGNQVFSLPDGVMIDEIGFANQELVFLPLTGRIFGYVEAESYVVLRDVRHYGSRRIMFNEYGVPNATREN